MSDIDLSNWEPEEAEPMPVQPKVELESMLKHVTPFRVHPKDAERRAKCIQAKTRRFECPGCGIIKWVEPTFSGEEWHYFGQCSHCGANWVNAYHLMVQCPECGAKTPITSKNPDGKCKCQGDTRGKY